MVQLWRSFDVELCCASGGPVKRWAIAAIATGLLLAACTPSKLAYGQVKSAMIDAGLSDSTAACMANRMTDQLSLIQLNKLKRLKGSNRSLGEFVSAVRRVNDPGAINVTVTSAALCSTGLAR